MNNKWVNGVFVLPYSFYEQQQRQEVDHHNLSVPRMCALKCAVKV